MNVSKDLFGFTRKGEAVYRYTLENDHGMTVQVLSLGGIIQSIKVPDRWGQLADVVLGCDTVQDYEAQSAYLGAIIGRYANRIARGRLTIEGTEYQLACNNGPNHLHGGNAGFSHRLWHCEPYESSDACGIKLTLSSPDGEEGYPGNLEVEVDYRWNNKAELCITYQAVTDKPTVVNLTQHSYFNLKGRGSCVDHWLQLNASTYLPTDSTAIPLGYAATVSETPMDFRKGKLIGQDINDHCEQLILAKGYDHNWIIDGYQHNSVEPVLAAKVIEPDSGRVMEVLTTKPGVQFYTGNYLQDVRGKGGCRYKKQDGFCLETQFFPNIYSGTVLQNSGRSDGVYDYKTIFKYDVIK
ncbi:galactose mutarotase [Endozoicomonas sp. Mp262]|uniref:aldose epimerase family protein n=1 Tax=Endozoicomonas sp. Mp262 TaxID=2919499 RepID=UPI0021DB250E